MPGGFQMNEFNIVTDSLPYVNGGLTFTYPANTFTVAPYVTVTTQTSSYSSAFLVSHMITSNSAASTTIRVNIYNSGYVSEAATGAVIVHISAFGPAA